MNLSAANELKPNKSNNLNIVPLFSSSHWDGEKVDYLFSLQGIFLERPFYSVLEEFPITTQTFRVKIIVRVISLKKMIWSFRLDVTIYCCVLVEIKCCQIECLESVAWNWSFIHRKAKTIMLKALLYSWRLSMWQPSTSPMMMSLSARIILYILVYWIVFSSFFFFHHHFQVHFHLNPFDMFILFSHNSYLFLHCH